MSVPRLIDGTGAAPRRDAAILVRDGVIVQVGSEQQVATPADAQAVRLTGNATAVPGLIDAHVHAAFDPAADDPEAAVGTDVDVLLRRCRQLLEAGVTTVRDCGSTLEAGLALGAASASEPRAGCRVLPCGPPVTPPAGHCWFLGGETEDTEHAARERVRQLAAAGVAAIKLMATGGVLTPQTDPGVAAFSASFMTALVQEAHRHGLPVTAHAHAVRGMQLAVAAGVDSLEHASMIGAGGGWEFDETLAESMRARGVRCVSTLTPGTDPGSRERLAGHPRQAALEAVSRQNRVRNFTRLREHGVPVVAGTDVGTPGTDLTCQLVLELEALVETGMSPMAAIRSATYDAAEHLGISASAGALLAGRAADITITEEDPSDDIRHLGGVVGVFRQGVPVRLPRQATAGLLHTDVDHREATT